MSGLKIFGPMTLFRAARKEALGEESGVPAMREAAKEDKLWCKREQFVENAWCSGYVAGAQYIQRMTQMKKKMEKVSKQLALLRALQKPEPRKYSRRKIK